MRRTAVAFLLSLSLVASGGAGGLPSAPAQEGPRPDDDLREYGALERALSSPDPGKRAEAVEVLGRRVGRFTGIARQQASRRLLLLLQEMEPGVRRAALEAAILNLRNVEGLLPALLDALLATDPDGIRKTFPVLLRRLHGDPQTRMQVQEIAGTGPDGRRLVAFCTVARLECLDLRARKGPPSPPEGPVLQALAKAAVQGDVQVRRFVLLCAEGEEALASALVQILPGALGDPDAEIRRAALGVAATAGERARDLGDLILRFVHGGPAPERKYALRALDGIGFPLPVDVSRIVARVLLDSAATTDPEERKFAAAALRRVVPEAESEAIAALKESFQADPDEETRSAVAVSLAALGGLPPLPRMPDTDLLWLVIGLVDARSKDPEWVDSVIVRMGRPVIPHLLWVVDHASLDSPVGRPARSRAEAGWALLAAIGRPATSHLLLLLENDDPSKRAAAASALGKCGPLEEDALLALLGGCLDTIPAVAAASRKALKAVSPGDIPSPPEIPRRVSAKDHRVRWEGKRPGKAKAAVDAALSWLQRHQSPDGKWDCDGFEAMCGKKNKCGHPGMPLFDPGVSGLALLAFLGDGETQAGPRYGSVVAHGLEYLRTIQDAEGCFGPRTTGQFVYNHALCSLAMAEAYGMTRAPSLRGPAQRGVDFAVLCRSPYRAWRYGVKPQDSDTSVTGWMIAVLQAGRRAGLEVAPDAFEGAMAWLDKVTDPEIGRAGYTARGNGPDRPQELLDKFPPDQSESLTAIAMATRIACGAKKDDEAIRRGADLCLNCLPEWDEAAGCIDLYYWYWGGLALFQVGGDPWRKWDEAAQRSLLGSQRMDKSDDRYGSWDAVDPWYNDGGRVYSTAINALTLETAWRYPRTLGAK